MVQKIVWSDDAKATFANSVEYLKANFSENEIFKFTDDITEKLILLETNPRLGRPFKRKAGCYKTVINIRIELYYRHKPKDNEITLLAFWNTQQDPRRLKIE